MSTGNSMGMLRAVPCIAVVILLCMELAACRGFAPAAKPQRNGFGSAFI